MHASHGTILIVEDDPGVARLQRRQLERAGYSVRTASTAGEAFEQARTDGIDLVLLDYRLPGGVTGLDVYRQIQAAGSTLPVILVTGFSDESTAIEALRAGVRDFVSKSAEYLDYLPEAIARVLKQVRTEKALWEKEEQLRQVQKLEAIGELAGGVAHEFNNLLQAISGYTSFAMDVLPQDHPAFEDLRQVEIAAERAATLTHQLLGFGRRQVLHRSTLDPNEAVSDLLKMLKPLIGAHIDVRAELDQNVDPVHADSELLQQMLLNLCVNARDAMPTGGRLTIKTAGVTLDRAYHDLYPQMEPGRYLMLTVADTGCGMPPEVKELIFEPFFTTKEAGKGTGLGLSMVYGVIQQHGGAIHVYSEPGIGTTFKIYLPTTAPESAADSIEPAPPVSGGHEMVLVAEDDPQVRDIAVRILRRGGYTVLTAADGEEAVHLFQQHAETIELALLDLVMPNGGGHEVYGRIKQIKPDVAVVFCSGYDRDTNFVEFDLEEPVQRLQKPYDPNALLRLVRETLDSPAGCSRV